MHDQMGVRDFCVYLFDAADSKNVPCRWPAKLVGPVACANGNGQGIHIGGRDKVGGFLGVGQQLLHGQSALGADAVFFAGHTSL